MKLTFVDLFAGVGMARIGMEQAGISDSQIYKAAGDGLSVPIAKEIGERIRKTYEENN